MKTLMPHMQILCNLGCKIICLDLRAGGVRVLGKAIGTTPFPSANHALLEPSYST